MLSTPTTAALALGGGVAAIAATLTHAAYSAQSQLFGPTLIAGNDPTEIALTYDDGPNDVATPALLELLARHNARATFFMIGKFARLHPAIVREVHAAGHLIGNHTQTHPWLTFKSPTTIREELRTCNEILEDILGAPIRYVRFPHGARRPAVLRIARELNLVPVQWNAIGKDWSTTNPRQILKNLEPGLTAARRNSTGANILLHDGFDQFMSANRNATLQATTQLLTRLGLQGCHTVTIDAWQLP
jgi:peptidoglycan-N-acetylglucosamine deacetylase